MGWDSSGKRAYTLLRKALHIVQRTHLTVSVTPPRFFITRSLGYTVYVWYVCWNCLLHFTYTIPERCIHVTYRVRMVMRYVLACVCVILNKYRLCSWPCIYWLLPVLLCLRNLERCGAYTGTCNIVLALHTGIVVLVLSGTRVLSVNVILFYFYW